MASTGCHGTRVGIGQGYLTFRRNVQGLLHRQKPFDLAPDAMISAGQMGGTFCPSLAGFLAVDPLGFLDIAPDLGFQMRKPAGDLPLAEVTVPVVDRLELAAVDCNRVALQHTDPTAELNGLCASLSDGSAVVAPEISDGLVIGHLSAGQPHQFHIAPGLPLQPPTGRDPV